MIAFTKTVAREVARKGITLTPSAPARPTTVAGGRRRRRRARQKIRAALVSAIPMKRVGQPDDIPGGSASWRAMMQPSSPPDDQRFRRSHDAWLTEACHEQVCGSSNRRGARRDVHGIDLSAPLD